MSQEYDEIHYLATRQAKHSLTKKLREPQEKITQDLLITYINYSLTLVDYWANLGLSDYEANELSDLHTELMEASHRKHLDEELKQNCLSFADSIHEQWRLLKTTRLN